MAGDARIDPKQADSWRLNELVRRRRLREQGRRTMAQNLEETLELSRVLSSIKNPARR